MDRTALDELRHMAPALSLARKPFMSSCKATMFASTFCSLCEQLHARRPVRLACAECGSVSGASRSARRSSWHCVQSPRATFLDQLRRCFSSIVVRRRRRYYGLICPPRFIVRQAQLGRLAFMSAFPSVTFADRSVGEIHRFSLPVETNRTSRFSRLECPRMHRVSDSAVSVVALP